MVTNPQQRAEWQPPGDDPGTGAPLEVPPPTPEDPGGPGPEEVPPGPGEVPPPAPPESRAILCQAGAPGASSWLGGPGAGPTPDRHGVYP
jgi:hypothetical protein